MKWLGWWPKTMKNSTSWTWCWQSSLLTLLENMESIFSSTKAWATCDYEFLFRFLVVGDNHNFMNLKDDIHKWQWLLVLAFRGTFQKVQKMKLSNHNTLLNLHYMIILIIIVSPYFLNEGRPWLLSKKNSFMTSFVIKIS